MTVRRPYVILGNPENRRVGMFQSALVASGRPAARVVAWRDFLRDPRALAALPDEPTLFRVEASGENAEVESLLLDRGHPDAVTAGCSTISPDERARLPDDRGRIVCPRQHHLGFLDALAELSRVLAGKPSWRVLNDPSAIADLFDKRVTSRRYAGLGIPVPSALEDVGSHEQLRARMEETGQASVYVKLSCGSSATCLAIYERRGDDEQLVTTIEPTLTAWYNSLRVRRIRDRGRIAEILAFLLREGSQVEASVPKARLEGEIFDCRVLVVAGEVAFVVVRSSRQGHPITNLHLGGRRGDVEALRRAVAPEAFAAAMDSCRRAAATHRCLHVGVDLLFEPGFSAHRILEANAFGDLLPGLQRDGLSVHEWEIRAAEAWVASGMDRQPPRVGTRYPLE